MKKIIVLGAGLIGKEIAIGLSKQFDVACSDIQMCSLEMLSPIYPITVIPCNFKDKYSLKELIQPFDLVINAVSSSIGFETLKAIIGEKKNVLNISHFKEDIFSLNDLAEKNAVSVVNCTSISKFSDQFLTTVKFILEEKSFRKGIFSMESELVTD